jgi:hypothetical protein
MIFPLLQAFGKKVRLRRILRENDFGTSAKGLIAGKPCDKMVAASRACLKIGGMPD